MSQRNQFTDGSGTGTTGETDDVAEELRRAAADRMADDDGGDVTTQDGGMFDGGGGSPDEEAAEDAVGDVDDSQPAPTIDPPAPDGGGGGGMFDGIDGGSPDPGGAQDAVDDVSDSQPTPEPTTPGSVDDAVDDTAARIGSAGDEATTMDVMESERRRQLGAEDTRDTDIDVTGDTTAQRVSSLRTELASATGLAPSQVTEREDGRIGASDQALGILEDRQAASQITEATGVGVLQSDVSVEDGEITITDPEVREEVQEAQIAEEIQSSRGIATDADDVEIVDGEVVLSDDVESQLQTQQAAGVIGGTTEAQREQVEQLGALRQARQLQAGRLQQGQREQIEAQVEGSFGGDNLEAFLEAGGTPAPIAEGVTEAAPEGSLQAFGPDLQRGEDFTITETATGLRASLTDEFSRELAAEQIDARVDQDVTADDLEATEDGQFRFAPGGDGGGDDAPVGEGFTEAAIFSSRLRGTDVEAPAPVEEGVAETAAGLPDDVIEVTNTTGALGTAFTDEVGQPAAEVTGDIADLGFRAGFDPDADVGDIQTAAGDVLRGEEQERGETTVVESGTQKLTEGAAGAAGMLVEAPDTLVGLGELGVGAGRFTAEAVDEEGVAGGLVQSGQAAAGAGASRLSESYEYAIQNPLRTTGTLIGTGAIMGGAGALSSRAGLASRAAIQPGEELIGFVGNRATGAVSSRAASTLFPDNEPILMSEEFAVKTAQRAGSAAQSGIQRARGAASGDLRLSLTPRQQGLVELARPEGRSAFATPEAEFEGEGETPVAGSEPLGGRGDEVVAGLDVGSPEIRTETATVEAETETETGTETDEPPLQEEIREEGGLGFFLRETVDFDEPRARLSELNDMLPEQRQERGQMTLAGRQRTAIETEEETQPETFQDFGQLEEARRQELAQRRELQSETETRREDPAERVERAQEPFFETETETRRETETERDTRRRVQPGADDRLGIMTEPEMLSDTLAGADLRPQVGADTDQRLGQEVDQELEQELEQEFEQEFEQELEQEFEQELEQEFEQETEAEQEFEFETETEQEQEFELEAFQTDESTEPVFGGGLSASDEIFGSGILSAEDVFTDGGS